MTEDQLNHLASWYRSEFRRRTKAIHDGEAKIYWLDPGTRVSLSEVLAYAESIGITIDRQDTIDLFHHINHRRDYA